MRDPEQLPEHPLDRKQQRERSITEALEREAARHDAAVANMHRLRTLRLEREEVKAAADVHPVKPRRHLHDSGVRLSAERSEGRAGAGPALANTASVIEQGGDPDIYNQERDRVRPINYETNKVRPVEDVIRYITEELGRSE